MPVTLPNAIVANTPHSAAPVMENFTTLRDAYNAHVHKGTGTDAPAVDFADIANKPTSYTPSAHTHAGGDVTSAVAEATHAVNADNATNATNATNSDKVDGCDAGTGPNNVLKLDADGKVPIISRPGAGAFFFAGDAPFSGPYFERTETDSDIQTWLSVGPTGSGANIIWTALDSVPEEAKGVRLNISLYASMGSSTDNIHRDIYVKFRKIGSSVSPTSIVATVVGAYDTDNVALSLDVPLVNRKFEFWWNKNESTVCDLSVTVFLEGWYL